MEIDGYTTIANSVRFLVHTIVFAPYGDHLVKYMCIQCDNPAKDWAYDGTDPTQLYGLRTGGGKSFYSRFPEFYMPMCRKCHTQRDGANTRRELEEYRTIKHQTGLTFEEILHRIESFSNSTGG